MAQAITALLIPEEFTIVTIVPMLYITTTEGITSYTTEDTMEFITEDSGEITGAMGGIGGRGSDADLYCSCYREYFLLYLITHGRIRFKVSA